MKKIKVLQIIDSLAIGGAEMLAVNSNNIFNRDSNIIESHLCVSRKEGLLKEKVVNNKYLFLNRNSTFDFNAVKKTIRYINKYNITIIHAHSTSYFFAILIKIFLPKIKIVWHVHSGKLVNSSYVKIIYLKIISFFFSSIVTVNSDLLSWVKRNLFTQINLFVNNFPYFSIVNQKTILHGVNEKRILILGSLREEKDHLNILESFNNLLYKNTRWTLHIVGAGNNDDYHNSLITYVNDNDLNDSVYFYGCCSDVKNILEQSTIGVLSSKSEGLPLALLEYGMAKLPVVITNVGECKKVVKHNYSGIIVPAENPKSLAKSIDKLINNKKMRQQFGEKLYNEVFQNYSKENYIEQLTNIYKQIL